MEGLGSGNENLDTELIPQLECVSVQCGKRNVLLW